MLRLSNCPSIAYTPPKRVKDAKKTSILIIIFCVLKVKVIRKENATNSTHDRYVKKVFMFSAEPNIEATIIKRAIRKRIAIKCFGRVINYLLFG